MPRHTPILSADHRLAPISVRVQPTSRRKVWTLGLGMMMMCLSWLLI